MAMKAQKRALIEVRCSKHNKLEREGIRIKVSQYAHALEPKYHNVRTERRLKTLIVGRSITDETILKFLKKEYPDFEKGGDTMN
jgi:hypothetical protein